MAGNERQNQTQWHKKALGIAFASSEALLANLFFDRIQGVHFSLRY